MIFLTSNSRYLSFCFAPCSDGGADDAVISLWEEGKIDTDEMEDFFSIVYVYDPATDTWTQASDMPTSRAFHTASVVDGKMYIIGGCSGTPGAGAYMEPVVDVYDPATDTWTTAADFTTPRWFPTAAVVDGKIYIIGGEVGEEADYPIKSIVSTVEEFDPGLPSALSSVSPGGKVLETWGKVKR